MCNFCSRNSHGKVSNSLHIPVVRQITTLFYAIRGEDPGEISLHFIVEAKSDNPRESDKVAVEAQRIFFEQMGVKNIQWKMETNVAEFEPDLKELAK